MGGPERIARVFLGSVVALGIANFSSGCERDSAPTIDNKPPVSGALTSESPKEAWEALSPIVRLEKLSYNDYPIFEGFNPQKETTLATVQLYCQQTKCNFSASAIELANAVHFIGEEEFNQKRQEAFGADIDSAHGILNFNKRIYINQTFMDNFINETTNNKPDVINELENKDLRTAYIVSFLAHELALINILPTEQHIFFDSFSITDPRVKEETIEFNRFYDFEIHGEGFYIDLGKYAIMDFAAYIIVGKMGLPYVQDPAFIPGSNLIKKLNRMADISNDKFLQYANGELSPLGLMKEWGRFKRDPSRNDVVEGILAFSNLALAMHELIPFQEAEENINKILKLNSNYQF
ncbi:hypothetical protein HYT32_01075 [Candidatus Roizmanbacteria bacterium]|nr:hypothetical protein [Candidatus Roizmanbacteria bacterium]